METGKQRTHRLKTWPEYWEAVDSGAKPFEVRLNDRDFQAGDLLELVECDPDMNRGGRSCSRRISYVLTGPLAERFGVRSGYAVLGLEAPA